MYKNSLTLIFSFLLTSSYISAALHNDFFIVEAIIATDASLKKNNIGTFDGETTFDYQSDKFFLISGPVQELDSQLGIESRRIFINKPSSIAKVITAFISARAAVIEHKSRSFDSVLLENIYRKALADALGCNIDSDLRK